MKSSNNQLIRNFTFLSVVHLINIAAPLLIVPYIIYRVGLSAYGLLAFHQYFGQFAFLFIDFGFSVYAVNEVSSLRGNKKKLANFIRSVYLIKIFLALLVIIVVGGILMSSYGGDALGISPVLLAGFVANAILNSFYPAWFYQGSERIHEMILPTMLSRVFGIVFIVLFLKVPGDIWLVPVAYCVGGLILLMTTFRTLKTHQMHATHTSLNQTLSMAKEALQVFWSRLIIMGYAAVSPILVRMAGGDVGVAIYSICEKMIALGRMPFDVYANAAYPRFAQYYDKAFAQHIVKKQLIVGLLTVAGALVILWSLRNQLVLLGISSLKYLAVYLVALIPIAMHSFIGTCVLMVNGHRLQLSTSIIFGLISYVVTYALSGSYFEDNILRVILSMVMVEFGILFFRYKKSKSFELL
jgi:PST family polysaccharide transporter